MTMTRISWIIWNMYDFLTSISSKVIRTKSLKQKDLMYLFSHNIQ